MLFLLRRCRTSSSYVNLSCMWHEVPESSLTHLRIQKTLRDIHWSRTCFLSWQNAHVVRVTFVLKLFSYTVVVGFILRKNCIVLSK